LYPRILLCLILNCNKPSINLTSANFEIHPIMNLTRLLITSLLSIIVLSSVVTSNVIQINDENWKQILKGEWMVKFFAPWCPACRSMVDTWIDFGKWTDDLNIDGVGEVDVTQSPGLSGRFLITSLPTILHVKDGEFRQYTKKREKDSLIDYVEKLEWKQEVVLPSWKHPDSIQMGVVASFFKVSMELRNIHSLMTEQYELPSWSVYVMFATVTILVGALLGLMLVFCIDCVLPYMTGSAIKQSDPVLSEEPIQAKNDSDLDDDVVSGETEESDNEVSDSSSEKKTDAPTLRKRGKKSTAAKI